MPLSGSTNARTSIQGTDSKVQYIKPTYGFPLSIGASGEMSLRADDSRKILLKLVGTEAFLEQQKLVSLFRAFLMTRVKTCMAQYMKNNAVSIFEIDEHLTAFYDNCGAALTPGAAFCDERGAPQVRRMRKRPKNRRMNYYY